MKAFSISVLVVIIGLFVIGIISAATTAYNQVDTLPSAKPKKEIPVSKPLERKEAVLDERRDMLKDSIAQGLEQLGKLPPRVQQMNATLKVAENNLKQTILKSDGDVQAIETVYRIDTSPRPVVIQIVYPTFEQPAKKRWFKRKD